MQYPIKYSILLVTLAACSMWACSKYKDPDPAQPDGRLTHHYCNDPKAINYNWGFPGIPDNSVCVYPVDSFLGQWIYTDTTYFPNGDISGITVRNINIIQPESDTTKTHLTLFGWCSNNIGINLIAGKYNKAALDTIPGYPEGQFFCNETSDTIKGFINRYSVNDTLTNTTSQHIAFDVIISNSGGVLYHKGRATKQ
jgi:hypothetical protein